MYYIDHKQKECVEITNFYLIALWFHVGLQDIISLQLSRFRKVKTVKYK